MLKGLCHLGAAANVQTTQAYKDLESKMGAKCKFWEKKNQSTVIKVAIHGRLDHRAPQVSGYHCLIWSVP